MKFQVKYNNTQIIIKYINPGIMQERVTGRLDCK